MTAPRIDPETGMDPIPYWLGWGVLALLVASIVTPLVLWLS